MARQHRTQAQWQQIIDDWQQSGLSGHEFCQREGINSKSFYRAKSRFTDAKQTPRFIQANPACIPSAEVTVILPGCRLQCSSLVSADWLAQVIRSLSG